MNFRRGPADLCCAGIGPLDPLAAIGELPGTATGLGKLAENGKERSTRWEPSEMDAGLDSAALKCARNIIYSILDFYTYI
jgi:hypothetical protein